MTNRLDEADWAILLQRIRDGKCTPFLGAGVNDGILPLGSQIARKWAKAYGYPLDDCGDLVRVAQFLAVKDPMFPKELMLGQLKSQLEQWRWEDKLTVFLKAGDQPLSLLADLPVSVYITTNYDNLLVRALELREPKKHPQREFCCWNKHVRAKLKKQKKRSIFDSEPDYSPTPTRPVVFHLHGHDEFPESLVIAEDDYLEFLVNMTRNPRLLPPPIEEAIASTSLLFIGYRLADWNFLVLWKLLKGVAESGRRVSVAVQLPPGDPEHVDQKVEEYLANYFHNLDVKVYWGKAQDFATELRGRWERFSRG